MFELDQILAGLIERTVDGKLKWNRTVRDNQFTTSIDAISVVIRAVSERQGVYRLEILDEAGEPVEVLDHTNTPPDQQHQLERLYVLARRSALNVQSTLDKLAKALEL